MWPADLRAHGIAFENQLGSTRSFTEFPLSHASARPSSTAWEIELRGGDRAVEHPRRGVPPRPAKPPATSTGRLAVERIQIRIIGADPPPLRPSTCKRLTRCRLLATRQSPTSMWGGVRLQGLGSRPARCTPTITTRCPVAVRADRPHQPERPRGGCTYHVRAIPGGMGLRRTARKTRRLRAESRRARRFEAIASPRAKLDLFPPSGRKQARIFTDIGRAGHSRPAARCRTRAAVNGAFLLPVPLARRPLRRRSAAGRVSNRTGPQEAPLRSA